MNKLKVRLSTPTVDNKELNKIKNSLSEWKNLVTIPTYPNMSTNQLQYIKNLIKFDRDYNLHD